MTRTGLLAALAIAVGAVPQAGLAQFGGVGGGPGFGGGMGAPAWPSKTLNVEVEAVGGDRVSGPIRLDAIVIECDFGRYEIRPEKVRSIRLSPAEGADAPIVATVNAQVVTQIPGTVVTTSGEEIDGILSIPGHWTITTDLGTLALAPKKLRSIAFLPDDAPGAAAGPPPVGPAEGGLGRLPEAPPQAVRLGNLLFASSASGDRVVVKLPNSAEAQTLQLPATDEQPIRVTPISSGSLLALELTGTALTRIAAFNLIRGRWASQDLREPVDGRASPIVNNELAAYGLGRHVYAFSIRADRWDVLELPEGVSAAPVVSAESVTVEHDGHIHTFGVRTGTWEHTDVRDLLSTTDGQAPARP